MTALIDEFHMTLAREAAAKSADPSTKVGACLVTSELVQYPRHNFFPTLLRPEEASREERYADVVHAEEAALLAAGGAAARGSTVYCTHEPCRRCWGLLLNFGVARVVFQKTSEDRRERWGCDEGRRIANLMIKIVELP